MTPRDPCDATDSCDAIVALGARVYPDGQCGPAATRRVRAAVAAYHQLQGFERFDGVHRGGAPVLVLAGGRRWSGFVEAVQMAQLARELGVPFDAMCVEMFSQSTIENARFCIELAYVRGWNKLAIVTCDWHLPRAEQDFRFFARLYAQRKTVRKHRFQDTVSGIDVVGIPARNERGTANLQRIRWVREGIGIHLDALRLRGRVWW